MGKLTQEEFLILQPRCNDTSSLLKTFQVGMSEDTWTSVYHRLDTA